MMRKCHLNTCPVGVATQDPVLRKKFTGKPEHVVNYFFFIAEEMRALMAKLGFRTVAEMIGRVDKLKAHKAVDHWKAKGLDLSPLLHAPNVGPEVATHCVTKQDHGLADILDNTLVERCRPAIERGEKVSVEIPIRNINRTAGTVLSSHIAKTYGVNGLPDDTIAIKLNRLGRTILRRVSFQGHHTDIWKANRTIISAKASRAEKLSSCLRRKRPSFPRKRF